MNMAIAPAAPASHYAAVRAQLADAGAITVLHIGAQAVTVAAGDGAAPALLRTLAIGAQRTARACFRRPIPARLEFEIAIEAVEDEIITVAAMLPPDSTLYASDEALRHIALLAGVPASATMRLELAAMERVWSRLAAVIEGKPAAQEGIPEDSAFAATLLILREFMHHLQFSAIMIVPDRGPGDSADARAAPALAR